MSAAHPGLHDITMSNTKLVCMYYSTIAHTKTCTTFFSRISTHEERVATQRDEVFLRTSVPENVIMLDEAFKQGFTCRNAECGMQFPLHSTRVRYWFLN